MLGYDSPSSFVSAMENIWTASTIENNSIAIPYAIKFTLYQNLLILNQFLEVVILIIIYFIIHEVTMERNLKTRNKPHYRVISINGHFNHITKTVGYTVF
jgi:hypothetical protein